MPRYTHRIQSTAIWFVTGSILVFLPIAFYAPKGLAPLFVATALIAAISTTRRPIEPDRTFYAFAAFIAYAMVSCAWSAAPGASLWAALMVAASGIGGWIILRLFATVGSGSIATFGRTTLIAGFIGFTLLAVEYATHGFLTRSSAAAVGRTMTQTSYLLGLKPGVVIAALFLWPWGYVVVRKYGRVFGAVAIVAAATIIVLLGSESAMSALIISALVAAIAFVFPNRIVTWLKTALAIIAVIIPVAVSLISDPTLPGSGLGWVNNSAIHRILIWRTTAHHIADHPVLGHGFDSSRLMYGPGTAREYMLLPDNPARRWIVVSEPIPLHPHNFFIQIWLETGGVGVFLAVVFLLFLLTQIRAAFPQRAELSVALGTFAAAFTIASIGFGAWQSWWLSALFMMSAITACVLRPGATVTTAPDTAART